MIAELEKLAGAEHYLALMLVLIFACVLLGRNRLSERVRQGNFWLTILVCTLLTVLDIAESHAQADPGRRTLRLLTSIAGYSLRPAAVLSFLLVVWPPRKKRWFLWIPVVLNTLLYSTAWFTPLAFTFDEEYRFQRGPLGWVVAAVCLFYLILVFIMVHIRFRDSRTGDAFVLYLCALGCLGAIAIDVHYGTIAIVSAILVSSMVFYYFLRTQDTDHDPLTHLWNRLVFYEDCRKQKNAITAIASVDMNGLKRTNDDLGHEAGDRALKMIGRGLRDVMNSKVLAYRIGGDEFTVVFLHCGEDEIQKALSSFQNEMWRTGLPVAIGYAAKTEANETPEELFQLSDKRMYEDKRMYYQLHDRRRAR